MKTVLLRLSGFAVLPLVSLITPLLLLPVISGIVGAEGISSVISGQAIGTFAATVLLWGWNIDGPIAIARADGPHERGVIYLCSVQTRLLLMLAVMPVSGLIAAVVAVPGFQGEAAAMSWAVAVAGLSPAWFCIGMGKPRLLAIYDTVPRFLATLAAAPVLLLTQQLWHYTVLAGIATLLALMAFQRAYSAPGRWLPENLRESLRHLKGQAKTAGISLAANTYASTPAPIATATTPPQASGNFATADTLYRFGLFIVMALGNALQSWTIEKHAAERTRRHVTAIWLHMSLGILGGLVLTIAGPFASTLLFAGKAQATTELCAYYGVAFAFLSASTPFIRNLLIPAGRQVQVLQWTLLSAAFGVAAMVWAGTSGSAPGVALGMALSEAILFTALLIPGLKLLREERASELAVK